MLKLVEIQICVAGASCRGQRGLENAYTCYYFDRDLRVWVDRVLG